MTPTTLSVDELERLARARRNPLPLAVVMSDDESTATTETWSGDLPDAPCGYLLHATALLLDPSRFDRSQAAASTGPDTLVVDVSQVADESGGIVDEVEVRGRVVVVKVDGQPRLAHLSDAGAVVVWTVDIHPAAEDRAQHPRMQDGRRIASFACTPNGNYLPRILLRLLASRVQPVSSVVVIPTQAANLLPGIPTIGEAKRRAKRGKSAPLDIERIMSTVRQRRVPTAVSVSLDSLSMRLVAESFNKVPRTLNMAVQAVLAYPSHASTEEEMQTAVLDALAHFDTDYLLTFDAVLAFLATASVDGAGTALDEKLEQVVSVTRFGPTTGQSSKQRDRVRRHFDTMRQVVVVVEATGETRFTGPLIMRTGQVDDLTAAEPLKVGDRVTLNPDLFPDLRKGRGLFVDTRYFRIDPYRQDGHLRLYRYLAARWSFGSVGHASRDDWTLKLKLADALDMAGVDWRTDVRERGRSVAEARRGVDAVMSDLANLGLVGPWSIDGDGLSNDCILRVEATPELRDGIVARRAKLHAGAAAGTLKRGSSAR